MRTFLMVFLILWSLGELHAEASPEPLEILQRIDQNRAAPNVISTSTLTIRSARGERKVKAKTWTRGVEQSFTEYLAPAREKGTKMLKLNNSLWTYYPKADRIVKIAGHLLRQSVMGSDLSYEDMMENQTLAESYVAQYEHNEEIEGRLCWVLILKAKDSKVAYQQRKIWVDQELFLPLKEELSSRRGKLLKIVEVKEFFNVQNRWYPKRLRFKDALKQGGGTEIEVHQIDFNTEIPQSRFSKRALRR